MKVQIHELDERKTEHNNDLVENHTKNYGETKEFYNQITRESLELIKVLRERLHDSKENIRETNEIIEALKKEMLQFQEPLQRAQQENELLRKSVATFDKDKMALRNARGCLKDLKSKNENIITERESLNKKFKTVE